MMQALGSFGMLLGRLCLSAIFIFAAIHSLLNYDQTVQYMASKGMTTIPLLLIVGAIVELIGGLSLIFGYKIRVGAILLLIFLIPTTLIFHDFWNMEGAVKDLQIIMFLKNLAIFGGLLYVLCCGSGGCAFDALNRAKRPIEKV
jgi:putative oxidoreductase